MLLHSKSKALRAKAIVATCFILCVVSLAYGADEKEHKTSTPIKHVVVIFQENVSFDHYFATYPTAANNNTAEPSFTASPNTPGVNGLTGPLLTANPNSAQPFRL